MSEKTILPWCWIIAHPVVPPHDLTLVNVKTDEGTLATLCRVLLAREGAEDVTFVILCASRERGEEYVQMLADGLIERMREASKRFHDQRTKIGHDSGAPPEQFYAWAKSLDL